jgi:hypothetical protein
MPADLREEPASLLQPGAGDLTFHPYPSLPKGVPAAPKTCAAFVKRAATKAPACADRPAALTALDGALAEQDATKRDAKLAGLEACAGMPVGLVRALRVELAPLECGDVLAEPLVQKPPKTITSPVYVTLLGQTLAARLSRIGHDAPTLAPPFDKPRVLEFIQQKLAPWLATSAQAVEETAQVGSKLTGYGRAIVAVEAGVADLRFVETFRSAPIPDEMKNDKELREVYQASLEEASEPRKVRGRDASLVGLADLAAVGALRDPRADRARALLSKLYGGRRIDGLDPLALPELAPAAPSTVEERLATRLPTFYAGQLLGTEHASKPELLRAFLEQGVPSPVRLALKSADLTPEAKKLVVRARIDLGRRYWRAFDFDEAVALAGKWTDRPEDVTLMLALGLALRNGPASAADMMRKAPLTSLGLGDVAALDAVSAKPENPYAAIAAYDAAIVRELSPPEKADAAYFKDVARRFRDAAPKLPASLKARAEEHAKAADAIAEAVGPAR